MCIGGLGKYLRRRKAGGGDILTKCIHHRQRMCSRWNPAGICCLDACCVVQDHPELLSVANQFLFAEPQPGQLGHMGNIDIDRHAGNCRPSRMCSGRPSESLMEVGRNCFVNRRTFFKQQRIVRRGFEPHHGHFGVAELVGQPPGVLDPHGLIGL